MNTPPEPASLAAEKERTLRIAWMLSAWAPLAIAVALVLGPSTILIADFLRRSSELLILVFSWLLFRRIARNPDIPIAEFRGPERRTSLWIAAVLLLSTVVILGSAAARLSQGAEVGWIVPGLLIATAGGGVNYWLWRRNRSLYKREPSPLSDAQWRFYRSKTLADICVVLTLVFGALLRGTSWSGVVDAAGATVIALFLATTARSVVKRSAGGVHEQLQATAVRLERNQPSVSGRS